MEPTTIAILFLATFGIIAGYFVARQSTNHEPVQGGILGQAIHYTASAIMISVAPTVICSLAVIHPTFIAGSTFLSAIAIAFSMMITAMLFLMAYAVLAKPALEALTKQEDTGWTEEDARTSGL